MKRRLAVAVDLALIFCIIFFMVKPARQKGVMYNTADFASYDKQSKIERLGSIADGRKTCLRFYTGGQIIKSIYLYFAVDKQDMQENGGVVHCSLEHNGEVLGLSDFTVRELSILSNRPYAMGYRGVEIDFDVDHPLEGYCTLTLEGEGIAPTTRISLLSDGTKPNLLQLTSDPGLYHGVMGEIRVESEHGHPYVWYAGFALAIALLVEVTLLMPNQKQSGRKHTYA